MDLDRVKFQAELDQLVAYMGDELKENYTREQLDEIHDGMCETADNETRDKHPLAQLVARFSVIGLYHVLLSMPPVKETT